MVMERVYWNHSMKDIPVPNEQDYKQNIIQKTNKFLTNLRWRAHFFLNPDSTGGRKETYGLPTSHSTPDVPEILRMCRHRRANLIGQANIKESSPGNQDDRTQQEVV